MDPFLITYPTIALLAAFISRALGFALLIIELAQAYQITPN